MNLLNRPIKLMVGSTVYGFQDQLSAICSVLSTYGYEVLNSHLGTVRVNPALSNLENCLNAVRECNVFLGVIRPFFGSGNIGELNITFEEIKLAMALGKPYWFLVHRDVTFMRQLKKRLYYLDAAGQKVFDVHVEKSPLFDERVLEIYDHIIGEGQPIALRTGNWAQEFYWLDEALAYVQSQFSDTSFIAGIVNNQNAQP